MTNACRFFRESKIGSGDMPKGFFEACKSGARVVLAILVLGAGCGNSDQPDAAPGRVAVQDLVGVYDVSLGGHAFESALGVITEGSASQFRVVIDADPADLFRLDGDLGEDGSFQLSGFEEVGFDGVREVSGAGAAKIETGQVSIIAELVVVGGAVRVEMRRSIGANANRFQGAYEFRFPVVGVGMCSCPSRTTMSLVVLDQGDAILRGGVDFDTADQRVGMFEEGGCLVTQGGAIRCTLPYIDEGGLDMGASNPLIVALSGDLPATGTTTPGVGRATVVPVGVTAGWEASRVPTPPD